jgi:hypothetical protein
MTEAIAELYQLIELASPLMEHAAMHDEAGQRFAEDWWRRAAQLQDTSILIGSLSLLREHHAALGKRLDECTETLAALIAALPRCDWQDSHGLPQLCTRPATQESRSSYGDYVACDECLGCAPDEHDYVDLPYAELLRKVPR